MSALNVYKIVFHQLRLWQSWYAVQEQSEMVEEDHVPSEAEEVVDNGVAKPEHEHSVRGSVFFGMSQITQIN